jgi:hypothetical protein
LELLPSNRSASNPEPDPSFSECHKVPGVYKIESTLIDVALIHEVALTVPITSTVALG